MAGDRIAGRAGLALFLAGFLRGGERRQDCGRITSGHLRQHARKVALTAIERGSGGGGATQEAGAAEGAGHVQISPFGMTPPQ